MSLICRAALTLVVWSATAATAVGSSILIDTFDTEQSIVSSDGFGTTFTRQAGPGIIGGERRLDAAEFNDLADGQGAIIGVEGGTLDVELDSGALATASASWLFNATDLTSGGTNDRFFIDGVKTNGALGIAINAFGLGGFARFDFVFPDIGTRRLGILFSDFETSGGFSFEEVTGLQLLFTADNLEPRASGSVDLIEAQGVTPIPLPASAALLIAGLIVLGAARNLSLRNATGAEFGGVV